MVEPKVPKIRTPKSCRCLSRKNKKSVKWLRHQKKSNLSANLNPTGGLIGLVSALKFVFSALNASRTIPNLPFLQENSGRKLEDK